MITEIVSSSFKKIASMSSNSKNNSKSNSLINQDIWTNNIKQDPKKFKERFSALKETTTKGNVTQTKAKKNVKMKTIQKIKKNEDYSEDEMDESVTVTMPKNNVNAIRQSTGQNYKEQKGKKIKKQISNNVPPTMIPQNTNKNFQMTNINVNNQFFTQNIPMNTMPHQEMNFININIAPGNGRFTQNIYMNFPNANIQPITNVNTNNIMVNQVNSYTNNKINLDNIIIGKDKRTTLMLRNIPNKYTLNNIVDEIGCAFWGKYDCINLPIDYETKLNLGYAFINFTDPLHIIHFFSKFHMKKWSRYKSEKKMDMTYADKQGKKDITLKAENNYFPQDDPRFDFKMLKPLIEIPNVSYNIYITHKLELFRFF